MYQAPAAAAGGDGGGDDGAPVRQSSNCIVRERVRPRLDIARLCATTF